MNARVLAIASLLPLAAVLVVSTAFAGSGERASIAQLRGVNFVSSCTFSHRAADDPIVFFGKPGASHDHSFVGNTRTNASSTLDALLASGTTCQRPGDTAAYWMPTLYVDGQPVTPTHAQIYYRRSTRRHVEAFPPGFRMIAGDAKATSPQPLRLIFWNCGVTGGVAPSSTVPTCPDASGAGTAAAREVPELLGRQEPGQREPRRSRRLPRRRPLPHASSPMRCPRSRSSIATRLTGVAGP